MNDHDGLSFLPFLYAELQSQLAGSYESVTKNYERSVPGILWNHDDFLVKPRDDAAVQ